MRVAVTGSSGFIGSALVASLQQDGHEVVRLVRRAPTAASNDEAQWDPEGGTIDRTPLEGADAVVNLAGEGIGNKRWTRAQKAKILGSRVKGTTLLATTLAEMRWPGVLVSGSAVGYYGLRGDEPLTERSTPGTGFLADVVKAWEAATRPAEQAGIRVVHLRSGIVVGRGGALKRLLPLFRLGLGGRLGAGRQWWSWISLADEVGIIRHAITADTVAGPINATAPAPVTNAEFTRALAKVLRRPAIIPVPAAALSLVMGAELTREVILAGQRVLPEVAQQTRYTFRHETVEEGLRASLLADRKP